MFGYIRPYKPELRFLDFSVYRQYYCGLCEALGRTTGPVTRMGLSYDMTFWYLFLASCCEEEGEVVLRHCPAKPWRIRPKQEEIRVGELAREIAFLTQVLIWLRFEDDAADREHRLRNRMLEPFFLHHFQKALDSSSQSLLREQLYHLQDLERSSSGDPMQLAGENEQLARILLRPFLQRVPPALWAKEVQGKENLLLQLLEDFGAQLFRWVYYADGVDDWQEDQEKGRANPFSFCQSRQELELAALPLFTMEEIALENIARRLPLQHHIPLIRNVLQQGLPSVHWLLLQGRDLPRL